MNVENETTCLTPMWTIKPTSLERSLGRLMRSPDGHEPVVPPVVEPSLVGEPPVVEPPVVDPNAPPVDPNAPPVEPPKVEEPPVVVEPMKLEDITLPAGLELQPELSTKFLEILNGEMTPKDRANALIALHGETLNAASEAGSLAWDNMQTEWKDAAKADPDIGGAKLQPTLTNIGKLLDEFGDKDTRSVFDLTGAGNNVHMIKFLNKIADTLVEGKFFKAGSPGGQDDPDAAAKRMFPSMKG